MNTIVKADDRYLYATSACTISWALIMGTPVISPVGNARTLKWDNGAILVVVEDSISRLEFPDTAGWIDVTAIDGRTLGSANRERAWTQPVLDAGLPVEFA